MPASLPMDMPSIPVIPQPPTEDFVDDFDELALEQTEDDGTKPPSEPLDALGLKSRIAYGKMLHKNRDITLRTIRFIK